MGVVSSESIFEVIITLFLNNDRESSLLISLHSPPPHFPDPLAYRGNFRWRCSRLQSSGYGGWLVACVCLTQYLLHLVFNVLHRMIGCDGAAEATDLGFVNSRVLSANWFFFSIIIFQFYLPPPPPVEGMVMEGGQDDGFDDMGFGDYVSLDIPEPKPVCYTVAPFAPSQCNAPDFQPMIAQKAPNGCFIDPPSRLCPTRNRMFPWRKRKLARRRWWGRSSRGELSRRWKRWGVLSCTL